MSLGPTLLATGLSLAALGWISATDPKRRRAFGAPPYPGHRRARAAWIAVLLPGLLVPVWSGAAGIVIWLGAVSALGWALVAAPPGWYAALPGRARRAVEGSAERRGATGRRLAALESRIAQLEDEVAALRLGSEPLAHARRRGPGKVSEIGQTASY